jgi:hypothetical protein
MLLGVAPLLLPMLLLLLSWLTLWLGSCALHGQHQIDTGAGQPGGILTQLFCSSMADNT